jgi:hypothetical protein
VTSIDAGQYWATVGNSYGMVTSRVATLTVLPPQPGTIDVTFYNRDFNRTVNGVFLQPDGRILISGDFVRIDGVKVDHVARLSRDGVLDLSYDTKGCVASYCDTCIGRLLGVQPDGKALIRGSAIGFGRLNVDGQKDPFAANDLYSVECCGDRFNRELLLFQCLNCS